MFVVLLLAACEAAAVLDGQFRIGDYRTKIEDLKRNDISTFLSNDWAMFDKYAKDTPDMFTHKMLPVYWYMQITPPFPTNWPLQKRRSVTYYAYAEYQELQMHGPVLSRSAAWAKVVLTEGSPAEKAMLSDTIGPVITWEASMPISPEIAARKVAIITDGEAHLSNFVSWTAVPTDESEVKAIREYYCQWALTNHLAESIKENHQAFFEWLACPSPTRIPVLQKL